jgi:hypothetical protein
MKPTFAVMLSLVLVVTLANPALAASPVGKVRQVSGPLPGIQIIPPYEFSPHYSPHAFVIPTFNITGVVTNTSVSILTANFPAGDIFNVTMGAFGTKGVGGILIGSVSSGVGGSFAVNFSIPAALAGSYRIAIRLQSPISGYYSYNWFYNNTTAVPVPPIWVPIPVGTIPTFSISAVAQNTSVTILTANYPAGDTFNVTMGAYGTKGIGGIYAGTINSGAGGSFAVTFGIPAALAGSYRIAIRLQSPISGYYSYNWFYNNNAP